MLIFGERHLRVVMTEYEAHYNDDDPIAAGNSGCRGPIILVADLSRKRIKRRPVLGGLLNEYERAA